jgi:hypothetical protein
VDLDFGGVFTGTALWLDIQVRTPPDGGYNSSTRGFVWRDRRSRCTP